MAHLALRYPNSRPFRIGLLPVVVPILIRLLFFRYFGIYEHKFPCLITGNMLTKVVSWEPINNALGAISAYLIVRVIDWAFCDISEFRLVKPREWEGGLIYGFEEVGVLKKISSVDRPEVKSQVNDFKNENLPFFYPGSWLPLELHLTFSPREQGWQRGVSGSPSPAGLTALTLRDRLNAGLSKEELEDRKWRKVGKLVWRHFKIYVLMDVPDCFFRFELSGKNGETNTLGWRLQDLDRGTLWWKRSFTILFNAFTVTQGVASYHCMCSYLALMISKPTDLPVVLANWTPAPTGTPLLATSFQSIWGEHWHQIFRPTFLSLVFRPVRKTVSKVGLPRDFAFAIALLCVFAMSGLLHEVGAEVCAYRFSEDDPMAGFGSNSFASTRFFVLQGVACLAETFWNTYVERALSKLWYGEHGKSKLIKDATLRTSLARIWVWSYSIWTGHLLVDIWIYHGISQGNWSGKFSRMLYDAIFASSS